MITNNFVTERVQHFYIVIDGLPCCRNTILTEFSISSFVDKGLSSSDSFRKISYKTSILIFCSELLDIFYLSNI